MSHAASPISDATADKPPRLKRWVPLSLRMFAAMLMVFGVASALLIWASYLESQVRQREQGVVQQIESWGGKVVRVPGGSDWLRQFARQDSLVNVTFFERINFIRLDGTATTDAGLALLKLGRLTNLEGVSLDRTPVTDTGLRHLRRLPALRYVCLSRTAVTDAGLAQLSGLKNLQELSLDGTAVTDGGLMHLNGLTGLKMLRLANTSVTDAGVAELQRVLPDLSVGK